MNQIAPKLFRVNPAKIIQKICISASMKNPYNLPVMNILEHIGAGKKNGSNVLSTLDTLLVFPKEPAYDPERGGVLQDLKDEGVIGVKDVSVGKLFVFENLAPEAVAKLAEEVLVEATHQVGFINEVPGQNEDVKQKDGVNGNKADFVLCVSYLPGVTNPELESLKHAAENLQIKVEHALIGRVIVFSGKISQEDQEKIARLFINKTVQYDLQELPDSLNVGEDKKIVVETVKIRELSDEELGSLSATRSLFLSLEEMKVIQEYYRSLDRDPTDCEMEIIAQVWSEHCGHKTFKANVMMNGELKTSLFSRIKKVTKDIAHKDVWSAFDDNAGVVAFDGDKGLALKAETHNAPSAIEPFGGAETGVGGVIRDIMGTGKGAKPVGVFDVLCFGRPDVASAEVPKGCLHPQTIFRKVVAGIQSYGNKIGLPNISGSLFFDNCYIPKPVVMAGCIGVIDRESVTKEDPRDGDVIICIGGKTGRDGIHGATFSSAEMVTSTKDVQSQAVQIGYPALEKRLMDVLQILGEKKLIRLITDCGAGGFSSAVTEMASNIGAEIDLSKISLKYTGLQPWEIFLSESQERMVAGIAREDVEKVEEICQHYGMNIDVIGQFRDNEKVLKVSYGDIPVAHLSLDFVFEKNPVQTIEGNFEELKFDETPLPDLSKDALRESVRDVLSHLNVCSREPIIRKYDHYVRTGNVASYYEGRHRDTPQDAMVFKPFFDNDRGFSVAHGMHPNIAAVDSYYGAQASAVEAIANLLCRGVDLKKVFLMDNFIHPKPDNKKDIGSLDREVDGLCEAAKFFGAPFVSGKDSLGGTFKGDDRVIKVKPTLCVTAVGIIPDVRQVLPNHFQKPENQLLLVGHRDLNQVGGSVFADLSELQTNNIPRVDLEKVKKIFDGLSAAIQDGKIASCHDVSDGGLITTLSEMAMGEGYGCEIRVNHDVSGFLFNETPGCFVIEVEKNFDVKKYFADCMDDVVTLGHIRKDDSFIVQKAATAIFSVYVNELRSWIKNPLFEKYFPVGSENLQIEQSKASDSHYRDIQVSLGRKPRAVILRAPGINSEEETNHSFDLAGAESSIVDIADLSGEILEQAQILVVPGGFSYADDLASGKIFATDLIYAFQEHLQKFAESEKLILGICNGFQVLVRTGLLPLRKLGSLDSNLIYNTHGFFSRKVRLEILPSRCVWTDGLEESIFSVPVAHGEGRFITKDPALLKKLFDDRQIVFRYVDDDARSTMIFPYNPNGSSQAVAGVCDPSGRILGLMPHPERDARNFIQKTFSSFVGLEIIKNGVRFFQ